MAIKIIRVHNTQKGFIEDGEAEFMKRVNRFMKLDTITINLPKKMNQLPANELKKKEAEKILASISSSDFVVLLDERGKHYTSREFAHFIDKKLANAGGHLIFIIGGAFGFDQSVYDRANSKLSLSKMTTSHQLVRLIFLEQLYRAFTIIHNHPYHND